MSSFISELPRGCPLMDNFNEYKLAVLGIFSVDDCLKARCMAVDKKCGRCECNGCCIQQGSI